jgi:Cys-rich protein (TIGR01571 family)
LTRLKLNAFACPASPTWVNKTFFIVVGLVVLVWFLAFLLPVIVAINYDCSEVSYSTTVNPYDDYNPYYDYNPYDDYYPYTTYGTTTYYECIYNEIPMGIVVPWLIICFVYWIYLLVMLTRLRGQYRRQYQIAGSCCDDCCCMYCCGFCNIIQMARHTHDEHIYKYQCCNTTGLPPDAPEIV